VDLRDKRELNRGFGDTLARGFELAATTAIFGFLGWLVDRWLGTQPLFILVLGTFAVVGQFALMWYRYDAEMKGHEANLPSARLAREPKHPA
jgi:F0F1-type ATP synthase assembly protein I